VISILADQVHLCHTLMREKILYETSKVIVNITHLEQASIQDLLYEDISSTFSPVLLERQKNKLLRLIMRKQKLTEMLVVSQRTQVTFEG